MVGTPSITPKIAEMVGLLADHAPDILARLQTKFPEEAEGRLLPGEEFGPAEPEPNLEAEVSVAALSIAVSLCDQSIVSGQKKLKTSNSFQLSGKVLTTVASASVLTTVAGDFPKPAKYITAIITLLASLATIFAGHVATPLHPEFGDLLTMYKKCIELQAQAEGALAELRLYLNKAPSDPNVAQIVNKGNDICKQIRQIAGAFGILLQTSKTPIAGT